MLQTSTHIYHNTKWRIAWAAHSHIFLDYNQGNFIQNWMASVHQTEQWQDWNIKQVAPGWCHECSYRRSKFFRTYWTNMKVKVSWITSLLVVGLGVTVMSLSQNGSPQSDYIWVPHRRRNSGDSLQQVKLCALSFEIQFPGSQRSHQFWLLYHDTHYAAGSSFHNQARGNTHFLAAW